MFTQSAPRHHPAPQQKKKCGAIKANRITISKSMFHKTVELFVNSLLKISEGY